MATINAPVSPFTVTSADGTRIQGWRCGVGEHLWLLPPGLGTPLISWKYLIEHFSDQMTIATWDPRGCYGSEVPGDVRRREVSDHVDDGLAVLDALGWDRPFVTGGWSMGVALGLELYARRPDQVCGLALIAGAYEHVLKTAFTSLPGKRHLLRATIGTMSLGGAAITKANRYLLSQPWTFDVLKRARVVAANESFFGEVLADFRELDFEVYLPMILALERHSARHILPTVKVPTLIVSGDKDPMTPHKVGERAHRAIPGSRFVTVPGGTHYTPIEFPEVLNAHLEAFFAASVFRSTWR